MKATVNSPSTAKGLALFILLFSFVCSVSGATKLSLTGSTDNVRYPSDAEVRLSLIDWSSPAQGAVIESAFQHYEEHQDLDAFLETLEQQDSRGYLFTAAATGYTIKYAWQEELQGDKTMVFLLTPGLKTRNPYRWKTPNNHSPGFTLLQLEFDNDKAIAKSSLEGRISMNEQGKLHLEDFTDIPVFATLEDSTPYYLK